MRNLSLFLILLNIVGFVFWGVLHSPGNNTIDHDAIERSKGGERLVLLSEFSASSGIAASVDSSVKKEETFSCYKLGPIDSKGVGAKVITQLDRLGLEATLRGGATEQIIDYWVYLEAFENLRTARTVVVDLRRQGYTSDLIEEGVYQNGVTVDFFAQEKQAQRVIDDLRKLGFKASKQVRERQGAMFWVQVKSSDDQTLSASVVNSLRSVAPGLQRSDISCA